jgi:hypothetical protein
MDKPAASPNRNVVARRVAVRPRVEARTTEVDCRRIAELLDAQAAPKPIEPDLEADIEIGTSSTATLSPRTPSRLAHTLRRDGAELARGSQPIAIALAEPAVVGPPIALALPLPAPPMNATVTTPMPVLRATILASDSTLVPDLTQQMPARSRIWWGAVAIAAFVVSGLALLDALRA